MDRDWSTEIVRRVPRIDERWLIDEEDMPETPLHDRTIELLVQVLRARFVRLGKDASVHRNIAVRFEETRPQIGCDPDVCVHEPTIPETETSICLWKDERSAPTLAVEIVSRDSGPKDYDDNPDRYAACGTDELWVFDPLRVGPARHGGPWRLQVWSRRPDDRFVQVYAGDGPAYSEYLGAWVVITDEGRRIRVADDEEGHALWPTPEEAALAALAAERAAKEAERAAKEAERAAKEAVLAELQRLREEIARTRG